MHGLARAYQDAEQEDKALAQLEKMHKAGMFTESRDYDVAWRLLPDGRAEFSVRDSGAGIAPEHIPRLTERFYRVDRSRSRETGGTGLGLSIVRRLVMDLQGSLAVESEPGKGTRIIIDIPSGSLERK